MMTPLPNLRHLPAVATLAAVPARLGSTDAQKSPKPRAANDVDDFAEFDGISGVRPLLRLVSPGTSESAGDLPDLTKWARLLPPEIQDLTAWARLMPPAVEDLTQFARLLPPEVPEVEDLTQFATLLSVWPTLPAAHRAVSRDVTEALDFVLGLLEGGTIAA